MSSAMLCVDLGGRRIIKKNGRLMDSTFLRVVLTVQHAYIVLQMVRQSSIYLYTSGFFPDFRRYFDAGACVAEMTDHKDWVQGVAWDPLNKFIATQGKDR